MINSKQPRPYLAPFSHNTSVTDGRTTDDNRAINSLYSIAVTRQKWQKNEKWMV